ncbi:MAG: TAT-variant-translocated molybdopterin oxidoreductase [Planctomycetes bacterium]|nr:TAT-variant-translocated molybdopterin oxidoreductase [Planctomycetota bacterium]
MNETQGKAYWRSLNDLADTPEFREMVKNEFPSRLDAVIDPVSRRRFVQVMGASMALAGLSGCDLMRWPEKKVLPYSRLPDERLPGIPVEYSSTMELGGVGVGVVVKAYDGRPIKIEGNDLHPESLGAATAYTQGSILQLYDPDRSKVVRKKGASGWTEESASDWAAFTKELGQRLTTVTASKGAKLGVLAEASSSPTLGELRKKLQATPGFERVTWVEWEPLSRETEETGLSQILGGAYRVHHNLRQADVVVCLDEDLFGHHPASLRLAREFADRRREMDADRTKGSRLYSIESTLSVTGTMADIRQPLQAGQALDFGLALAAALAKRPELEGRVSSDELRRTLAKFAGAAAGHEALIEQMAADLTGARGRSVIAVGPRQSAKLHGLVHLLNGLLGNVGATVRYTKAPEGSSGVEGLKELHQKIADGKVDTLLVIGANPAYTAPSDLDFNSLLEKQGLWSAHLGLYQDETGLKTSWHLPRSHYLEAWGDARAYDGTICLTQPLIAPLYAGKSAIEFVSLLFDPTKAQTGYDLVRGAHKALGVYTGDFEAGWRAALHGGVLDGTAATQVNPDQQLKPLLTSLQEHTASQPSGYELVFTACSKIYDGRFGNNGWLQELPDPITKLTWDNALLMSEQTASEIDGGLKEGDLVTVNGTLEAAVYVLPAGALPDKTVTIALGYGRKEAVGVVGANAGFNAYPLRTQAAMGYLPGVTIKALGQTYVLATTQDHQSVLTTISKAEIQRRTPDLVHEGTLDRYTTQPNFAKNVWEDGTRGMGPDPATTLLWKEPQAFEGRRWGMVIDLSVCTGCSACVVACQAENNIPVVGKSEVQRGREMQWLRIDRYFSHKPLQDLEAEEAEEAEAAKGHGGDHGGGHGESKLPPFLRGLRVVHQPMPCQQCENAPCESVCPVAATTHSAEGLNDMTYNRCIGTRYCANNCPWKVRRFNYFYNHHGPFHPRSSPGHKELPKLPSTPFTRATGLPLATVETKVEELVYNPEVTVRSRGVMEKCTYCVQRIKAVSIPARNASIKAHAEKVARGEAKERDEHDWKVEDGAIVTACQQSCATQAITFGDLSDPDSRISKLRGEPGTKAKVDPASQRVYTMLPELNARPRTSYLARIRNLPKHEA